LAAAEYESMCLSFDSRKRGGLDGENSDRERHKGEEHNLMERVRLALMRFPTEFVTNERAIPAWMHVKEALVEFCKHSTNALVLSRGIDLSSISNDNSSNSAIAEKRFAILLSDQSASDTSKLAAAVSN
jgi:hypothetical protein